MTTVISTRPDFPSGETDAVVVHHVDELLPDGVAINYHPAWYGTTEHARPSAEAHAMDHYSGLARIELEYTCSPYREDKSLKPVELSYQHSTPLITFAALVQSWEAGNLSALWVRSYDVRLQRNRKIYEWHQQYGDIIAIAPGQVSVSSLSCTREIYSIAGRHPKSAYFDHFSTYGCRCIFTTRGCREHRMMRKRTFQLYQPKSIYRPSIIEPIRTLASATIRQMCARMGAHQKEVTVNVLTYCNRFSFDNSTRLALGARHSSHAMKGSPLDTWMLDGWEESELWDNLAANVPLLHSAVKHLWRRFSGDANFLSNDERLQQWTTEQLDLALHEPHTVTKDSLLGWLLEAKSEDGARLSRSEIAEEIIDNILAAQATVTLALTFSLWDLACNSQWQEMLREELRRLPAGEDGFPTFESVIAAPILDSCTRESSRIHPLSSGHAERVVPIKKLYDGVMLPAGVTISASTLALHHSATAFEDPYSYRPGRWLQAEAAQRSLMEKHHMPFGYGARFCLGATFALVQIKMLVAFIVLRLELRPDPSSPTDHHSMDQLDTQNALPRGLRCDLSIREIDLLSQG
ncbi:hypothetical protein FG10991.1 [Paecilomyces variotii No. 5]|uniref:Cytochrome P450 n=1 Tax=Byssochlamys spectabilis (strain No. 5 / NBRC 109023) TaxID=1356009 RepID=V5FML3_BYSSN|nr:hypothetical protein FG10991.1 [Paecilomyces variotii No. 5]